MFIPNEERFQRCLLQFYDAVLKKQAERNCPTMEISFSSGYIRYQEWYKRDIYDKAQRILGIPSWSADMVGTGEITKKVLSVMKMRVDSIQQNLLNWRDVTYDIEKKFSNHLYKSEDILYRLFTSDGKDEALFGEAIELWGKKFPLLSFLFFIKDCTKYVPARPDKFRERFKRLGFETDCLSECTWENYQTFLEIMKWVQEKLAADIDRSAELIDAHSFVWMMGDIDDTEPEIEIKELLNSDDLETTVIRIGTEGRKIEHYGRRYERNPQNRKAAIEAHGYTCMACGFDFKSMYELGENFIEVHHIKPLHTLDGETNVDPVNDMICLCSNCHRMIHHKKNYIMTLSELKDVIERNQSKKE
ncbi:MAG: HNH endonuclease [Oscillospiraceae bacterium]|nr:HNH endonuclease [Oscillospiraceae bacterium]